MVTLSLDAESSTPVALPQHPVQTNPSILKADEAAAFLRISPRTLWTLTNALEIPHVRLGRAVRYRRASLEEWMEVQESKSSRSRRR
jgi:excisionase family DNA binding protein